VGKERRRRPRRAAADWQGRYRFGGATGWRDCELVDVSDGGAGFQAYLLPTDALPFADVELELTDRAESRPDPFRLAARVRHLARSEAGHVRVGVEFVGLSDLETQLLGMLFRRDASRSGSGSDAPPAQRAPAPAR
jgi:hypothetical protein